MTFSPALMAWSALAAPQTHQPVDAKPDRGEAEHGRRMTCGEIGNQQGNPADTGNDQQHVRYSAKQDNRQHMLLHESLSQDKGVLRTNRQNQREAERKTGKEG